MQTGLEGLQLQEACSTRWGQNAGRARADQTDGGGGMQRGPGRDVQTQAGDCAKLGVSKAGDQAPISHGGGGVQIPREGCKPWRVLANPGGPCREEQRECGAALGVGMSLGVGMQTLAGQGGAGKAGRAGKGWGASPEAWPRPRRLCRPEAQGTRPGTPAPGGGGPHLPCPAP